MRGGRARRLGVEVGLMNDDQVQIVDGINEDEIVVLAPGAALTDGTRATPVLP